MSLLRSLGNPHTRPSSAHPAGNLLDEGDWHPAALFSAFIHFDTVTIVRVSRWGFNVEGITKHTLTPPPGTQDPQ